MGIHCLLFVELNSVGCHVTPTEDRIVRRFVCADVTLRNCSLSVLSCVTFCNSMVKNQSIDFCCLRAPWPKFNAPLIHFLILVLLLSYAYYCVTSRREWALLLFRMFVCLYVRLSFRDLQPTTIDRSQPNLVCRYIPVLAGV